MHLLLSEKYMAYKDLADRCVLKVSPGESGPKEGDRRCFYMAPKSIFLDEPRV